MVLLVSYLLLLTKDSFLEQCSLRDDLTLLGVDIDVSVMPLFPTTYVICWLDFTLLKNKISTTC